MKPTRRVPQAVFSALSTLRDSARAIIVKSRIQLGIVAVVLIIVTCMVVNVPFLLSKASHDPKNGGVSVFAIVFAVVVGVVIVLGVLAVAMNHRPDTPTGTLRFAGLTSKMIRRAKADGFDIKSIADVWKESHPETGVSTWTRFGRPSMWRRRISAPARIASMSQDRKTSHIAAILDVVGVPEDAIRHGDVVRMAHLYRQGVPAQSVGWAADNDIDSSLFASFGRGYRSEMTS
jgi:hypothetical protein